MTTFSTGFSVPFATGAGAGFGDSASGFFAAREAQLNFAAGAGAGAGTVAAAVNEGAFDAAGGTASATGSGLTGGFSSPFFSLTDCLTSSGFVTDGAAETIEGEDADAVFETAPPGTKGCASFGSGLLDSVAGTKGGAAAADGTKAAAVGVKVNDCPGTNSHAPGLNENSFAFGLSGIDQNAPKQWQTAKHTTLDVFPSLRVFYRKAII